MRLAAYAVCIRDARVLLAHYQGTHWTLPGGRVEHAEDPLDTVVREVAEETGYDAVVERLLGVDSRVIPAAEAHRGEEHQNVGILPCRQDRSFLHPGDAERGRPHRRDPEADQHADPAGRSARFGYRDARGR